MSNIQIFVEGIADQKFFKDLIAHWYGVELSIDKKSQDIISLDGKDAFNSPDKLRLLVPQLQQLLLQGKKCIVIFDADTFEESYEQILVHSQNYNFAFFLLPNNTANGDLESLLQELIHPDNQIIFDCWQAYEQCLKGQQTNMTTSGSFTLPARKTKIYAYLEALLGETKNEKEKIKEKYRDYRNDKHWVLDPSHPSLKSLKKFLDPFFVKSNERIE